MTETGVECSGGLIFGVTLVFGILDEVGLVVRISYLFDGTMAKLGLPGKVMMPFLSGFGCNIASVHGMRVVDSWGQRVLGIALAWAVPCGSTLALEPVLLPAPCVGRAPTCALNFPD